MGTASIPRQPSEPRSSRGHGGAEQSPKQCQEQGLAPRALPALYSHPNPVPAPSSPTPRPTARSQLHFPTTPEIHDFGVVQTQHAPIPAWECSHVADSVPCPAMGTMPSPRHSTPGCGTACALLQNHPKIGEQLGPSCGILTSPAAGGREPGRRDLSHTLRAPFCSLLGWSLLLLPLLLLLLLLLPLRRSPGPACSHYSRDGEGVWEARERQAAPSPQPPSR